MILARDIKTIENPLAFVQKLAFRRCVDRIRRKRPQKSLENNPNTPNPGEPILEVLHVWIERWVEQNASAERAEACLEAVDILRDALHDLDEPCHGLLKARFEGALSYKEISAARGIPSPQVGVYISRCIRKLKKLLQSDHDRWMILSELWDTLR